MDLGRSDGWAGGGTEGRVRGGTDGYGAGMASCGAGELAGFWGRTEGQTDTRGWGALLPTATPGLRVPCPPRGRARQDGERWAAALQRAQREALEREATRGAEQARQQELIRDMKGRLLELLR